jgi:hypothetical protein
MIFRKDVEKANQELNRTLHVSERAFVRWIRFEGPAPPSIGRAGNR